MRLMWNSAVYRRLPLTLRYPNLLVTQTLSKSDALAGLRVGYAVGHAELITALTRVKDSFNSFPLDRFAQAGAAAAIQDQAYCREICDRVVASRKRLVAGLEVLRFSGSSLGWRILFWRAIRATWARI